MFLSRLVGIGWSVLPAVHLSIAVMLPSVGPLVFDRRPWVVRYSLLVRLVNFDAISYLLMPVIDHVVDLQVGNGWLRAVLIGSFVELLVACQRAFADYFLVFLVRMPVVDGLAVF